MSNELGECTVPPEGWYCTRGAGHEGPCAAIQEEPFDKVDELATKISYHRLIGSTPHAEARAILAHFDREQRGNCENQSEN